MKIDKLVTGLIVIVLAALLLANGIITVVEPSSQLFAQNAVNIIVAFVLVVLAGSYFNEAKQQKQLPFFFLFCPRFP